MIGKCVVCATEFHYYPSNRSGKYCSAPCTRRDPEWIAKQAAAKKGKRHSEEARQKMSASRKGVPKPPGFGAKISAIQKGRENPWAVGPLNWNWKGGAGANQKRLRASRDYRLWRQAVLERDGKVCTKCGATAPIEVDHVIPFAFLVREGTAMGCLAALFDIENGRTLCKPCHKATSSYAAKAAYGVEAQLFTVIENDWKENTDQTEEFNAYYQRRMNKLIDAVKLELSD